MFIIIAVIHIPSSAMTPVQLSLVPCMCPGRRRRPRLAVAQLNRGICFHLTGRARKACIAFACKLLLSRGAENKVWQLACYAWSPRHDRTLLSATGRKQSSRRARSERTTCPAAGKAGGAGNAKAKACSALLVASLAAAFFLQTAAARPADRAASGACCRACYRAPHHCCEIETGRDRVDRHHQSGARIAVQRSS